MLLYKQKITRAKDSHPPPQRLFFTFVFFFLELKAIMLSSEFNVRLYEMTELPVLSVD